jgi:hypothetical protein
MLWQPETETGKCFNKEERQQSTRLARDSGVQNKATTDRRYRQEERTVETTEGERKKGKEKGKFRRVHSPNFGDSD